MGLDTTAAKVICAARSLGANFEKTATIGRQGFGPSSATLQKIFGLLHIDKHPDELRAEKFSEPFFKALGAQSVNSVDYSNYEGATNLHDMNLPLPHELRGRYSVVFDGGTLEHIFNVPQAVKNFMEMVRVGGHFIQVTCGNNFMGHGLYQFSPEFMYRVFSPENGFQTLAILLQEVRATSEGWRGPWFLALDPKKIGWRIEFRNSRPTYIIVIAQRKADAPIFAAPPQQSDYQTAWEASTDATASQSPAKSALRLVRRIIPPSVERMVRSSYNPHGFVRINEDDLLLGRIPPAN